MAPSNSPRVQRHRCGLWCPSGAALRQAAFGLRPSAFAQAVGLWVCGSEVGGWFRGEVGLASQGVARKNKSHWPGLLKRYLVALLKHVAFSIEIKRNHHLQGNVQVYTVRIPVGQKMRQGEQRQKVELVNLLFQVGVRQKAELCKALIFFSSF